MTMFTIIAYRESPFKVVVVSVVCNRKVSKWELLKKYCLFVPFCPGLYPPWGSKHILSSQQHRFPPFPILQQLPLMQDVVFWAAAIIGCLVATRGVVWSLILPALIQSDSDRHIKMQILACALLAILSLPFSLCGMLRGEELERWPWGWIFKWPPDFPTEQHQPGFHLHSSLSRFTAHQRWLTQPQLSIYRDRSHTTSNSDCVTHNQTVSYTLSSSTLCYLKKTDSQD